MYMVLKKLIHKGKIYRAGELVELGKTEAKDLVKRELVEEYKEPINGSDHETDESGESADSGEESESEET